MDEAIKVYLEFLTYRFASEIFAQFIEWFCTDYKLNIILSNQRVASGKVASEYQRSVAIKKTEYRYTYNNFFKWMNEKNE